MSNEWLPGHWKIHPEYNMARDDMDIFLGYKNHQDKAEVLLPAQFSSGRAARTPWISGELGISPTMFLQDMLEAAWSQGLRPKNFADQKGTLEATKEHLRDMRAIVGTKLKVQW